MGMSVLTKFIPLSLTNSKQFSYFPVNISIFSHTLHPSFCYSYVLPFHVGLLESLSVMQQFKLMLSFVWHAVFRYYHQIATRLWCPIITKFLSIVCTGLQNTACKEQYGVLGSHRHLATACVIGLYVPGWLIGSLKVLAVRIGPHACQCCKLKVLNNPECNP